MKVNTNTDLEKCFKISLGVKRKYSAKTVEFQPSSTFSECGSFRNTVPHEVHRRRLRAHTPCAVFVLKLCLHTRDSFAGVQDHAPH